MPPYAVAQKNTHDISLDQFDSDAYICPDIYYMLNCKKYVEILFTPFYPQHEHIRFSKIITIKTHHQQIL